MNSWHSVSEPVSVGESENAWDENSGVLLSWQSVAQTDQGIDGFFSNNGLFEDSKGLQNWNNQLVVLGVVWANQELESWYKNGKTELKEDSFNSI